MTRHISHHPAEAQVLEKEILDDIKSKWFLPLGKVDNRTGPGDFDYGKMKFVNRNLNYFYLNNMIYHAIRNDYQYNPNYTAFLNFSESIRTITNESGPFGRMCIWNLQPKGYLLPHFDNWEYHRNITRYIFCISNHSGAEVFVKIGDEIIDIKQGLLFNFYPSKELHEFVNNTDRDFYFYGFDYWIPDNLHSLARARNITVDTIIPYQPGYGGVKTTTEYTSEE